MDGKKYHKACFKCEQCKKALTQGDWESHAGKVYCKPHAKAARSQKDEAPSTRPRAVSNPRVEDFRPVNMKLQSVEGMFLLLLLPVPGLTHVPLGGFHSDLQSLCHGDGEEAEGHRQSQRLVPACC